MKSGRAGEETISTADPGLPTTEPEVPLIVRVDVPVGVALPVVTVRVDEFPRAGLGENVPTAPLGRPATGVVSMTASANPPVRVIVIV